MFSTSNRKLHVKAGQEEEERGWQQHQDQQQLLVQNGQQQVRGSPPELFPGSPLPANLQRTKGIHKADAASAAGKMIAKQHVLAFPAETGCVENMLHMFAQTAHRCCRQRSPSSIATMMNCPEQCPLLPAVIETMVNNKLNTRPTVWAVGKRCLSHLYLWPCRQKRSA